MLESAERIETARAEIMRELKELGDEFVVMDDLNRRIKTAARDPQFALFNCDRFFATFFVLCGKKKLLVLTHLSSAICTVVSFMNLSN